MSETSTPLAAGLGAAAPGLVGAGIYGLSDVISGRRAMRKRYEGMVHAEHRRAITEGLGLSNAAKGKALSDARAAIRGDQRELQAEVARNGGVQKVENLGALANARASGIAQARSNIQAQSDALNLERTARLRQEMAGMGRDGPGIGVKALAVGLGTGVGAGLGHYADNPESSRRSDSLHDAYTKTQENAAIRQMERDAKSIQRKAYSAAAEAEALNIANGVVSDV